MAVIELDREMAKIKIFNPATNISKSFTSEETGIESISYMYGCYDGNAVGVGCVYFPSITISMDYIEEAKMGSIVEIFFKKESDTDEDLFGRFFINSQPRNNSEYTTNMTLCGMLEKNSDVKISFSEDDSLIDPYKTATVLSVVTIIQEITGLEIIFDTDEDTKNSFLSKEITIPTSKIVDESTWEITSPTIKEMLSGLGVMFGGNVVEMFGKVHFIPKNGYGNFIQFEQDEYVSYEVSSETYGIQSIALEYLKTEVMEQWDGDIRLKSRLMYNATERATGFTLISQGDTGAEIKYNQVIQCDWAGASCEHNDNFASTVQGDLTYHTGKIEFSGRIKDIIPGTTITFKDRKGEIRSLYAAEINITWDGGFYTEISCQCNVDASSKSVRTSSSEGSSSSNNFFGAIVNHNNASYADTMLANVAVISEAFIGNLTADEGFIGSLTANEIFTDELTANKAFIESLTASKAFIDELNADVANITTLKASDAIIQNIFSDRIISDSAIIETLQSNIVTADIIRSATAEVGYLKAEEADLKYADIKLANIADGTIKNAMIGKAEIGYEKVNESFIGSLTADTAFTEFLNAHVASLGYLNAASADIRYADICFANIDTANIDVAQVAKMFAKVGLIDRATIEEGHVTGFLDAVEVNAKSITTGELATDRLVIRGSEKSIVYEINNITGALQALKTDTINGEIITQRTISADKIISKSITANEIDVANLFAQNIVASGTITGARLYGTYAEITGGSIGNWKLHGEFDSLWNQVTGQYDVYISAQQGRIAINKNIDGGTLVSAGTELTESGLHTWNGGSECIIGQDGNIEVTGDVSSGSITTSCIYSKGNVELYHPAGTPYIDFHHGSFGNESSDYTSRIIEELSGELYVYASRFTVQGKLTTAAHEYGDGYSYGALDMRNSNIRGLRAIYTSGLAPSAEVGINFYLDETHVDSLWASGGKLYFSDNRSLGQKIYPADSPYVLTSKNYITVGSLTAYTGSILSGSFVKKEARGYTHLHAHLSGIAIPSSFEWTKILKSTIYPSGDRRGLVQITDGGLGEQSQERAAVKIDSRGIVYITVQNAFTSNYAIIDIFW